MILKNSVFNKEITVPASKSHANRALILGAISGSDFKVTNLPQSTDVLNLISCFKKIGLNLIENNSTIVFKNSFPGCELKSDNPIVLYTGDGGTTNRFLLALLSLGKNEYYLIPSEKMKERPISDFITPLRELGVEIKLNVNEDYWLSSKRVRETTVEELNVNCEVSTQFATALKLAYAKTNIKFNLLNIKSSFDYLRMTDFLISQMSTGEIIVPVDFSSMSYPLALAAISGDVLVNNCYGIDPYQADSKFIEILKSIQADLEFTSRGLRVSSKNKLRPFEVDGSECPDLVMTLAFLASHIDGQSKITNIKVLRYKESDRIDGLLKLMREFAVSFNYNEDADILLINGPKKNINEKNIITERDHRMVMVASLYLKTHSGGSIANEDCVKKSYSDFFEMIS